MQLHRDYVALHMGPPDAPMLYPGQSLRAPDMSGKAQQLALATAQATCCALGAQQPQRRLGSPATPATAVSSVTANPRSSSHSGTRCQAMGTRMANCPARPLPTCWAWRRHRMQQQQQQQQRPQDPQQSGSVLASPVESADHQQRQAQAMQQPGFAPGQRPHHPYGDPLLLVGWQPRPPSYYNPAGPLMPRPAGRWCLSTSRAGIIFKNQLSIEACNSSHQQRGFLCSKTCGRDAV